MDLEKNFEEAETLCEKCNRYIRTANYLIHEARCPGPSRIGTAHRSRMPKI